MQTEIKTAKISEIKLNPDNPRTISNKDMELLIKSLKEFPEMLHLREIVVDENMVVLGGNMRLLALQKMGVSDCQIRMVSGLTPEQKREFVIKDNSNFGRYDFDSLANEWSDLPLADWGVDLPDDWIKNNEKTNQNINEIYELKYNVIVECDNEAQQKELLTRFEEEGLICRALIL
jgi:hypothetical protein